MKAWSDFRRFFAEGNNMIRKIIIANILVFFVFNLVGLFILMMKGWEGYSSLFNDFVNVFAVPAELPELIIKPWTVFTYSFVHIGLFHLIFNLLFLYWLGSIFREYLGNTKTLSTYVFGGLFGAALYVLGYNTLPFLDGLSSGTHLIGASAGVLALVVAIGTFLPFYEVPFFNLFIPLRWIAIGVVALSFLMIPHGNMGGQLAHLGGALYGFLYARRLRRNTLLANKMEDFGDFVGKLFRRKSNLTVVKKETTVYSSTTIADFDDEYEPNQEEIDAILDKINQSGYESLTRKEREMLFKASRQH